MAQSKSFFGLRKGSTKSLTFQVLNGKQITKDRVYNVKNPQTIAQMQQRAIMATVIAAYSSMKTICDHSFEGCEVGAKSMAEFMRINLKELRGKFPDISISDYKNGNYAPNQYIVSNGSLPQLYRTKMEIENDIYDEYSTNLVANENTTFGDIAQSLSLQKGAMITAMLVSDGVTYWLRLKFTEDVWSKKVNFETNIVTQMLESDPESVEGDSVALKDDVTIVKDEKDGSKIKFRINKLEATELSTIILSEKSEGKWKRSKAYLYGEIEYNFDSAFSTYPINTTLLLNGGKMPSNIIKK